MTEPCNVLRKCVSGWAKIWAHRGEENGGTHTSRSNGKWTAFIWCFTCQWQLKVCYNIHPFIITFTHRWRRPRKAVPLHGLTLTLSVPSLGAVSVRCLAQGHLDTQLGGAGDRTSNLLVPSQPRSTSWATCCLQLMLFICFGQDFGRLHPTMTEKLNRCYGERGRQTGKALGNSETRGVKSNWHLDLRCGGKGITNTQRVHYKWIMHCSSGSDTQQSECQKWFLHILLSPCSSHITLKATTQAVRSDMEEQTQNRRRDHCGGCRRKRAVHGQETQVGSRPLLKAAVYPKNPQTNPGVTNKYANREKFHTYI